LRALVSDRKSYETAQTLYGVCDEIYTGDGGGPRRSIDEIACVLSIEEMRPDQDLIPST